MQSAAQVEGGWIKLPPAAIETEKTFIITGDVLLRHSLCDYVPLSAWR